MDTKIKMIIDKIDELMKTGTYDATLKLLREEVIRIDNLDKKPKKIKKVKKLIM